MRILLTNDDGIDAPGLKALQEAVAPLGQVRVVAPEFERSATGQAIMVRKPCRLTRREPAVAGIEAFAFDANPADCVKYALSMMCVGEPPDLVISGINRGQNSGNNVNYSGTVGAALEAAMFGVRAMAVSLAAKRTEDLDFSVAADFARRMAPRVASAKLPPGVVININVPHLRREEIKGVAWCKQGHARFVDHWEALPEDNLPQVRDNGSRVFRNMGEEFHVSDDERNDDNLLHRGFITVCPLSYDLTHRGVYENPPPFDLKLD